MVYKPSFHSVLDYSSSLINNKSCFTASVLRLAAFCAFLLCCGATARAEYLFDDARLSTSPVTAPTQFKRERIVSITKSGGWITGKALQPQITLNLFEDVNLTGVLEKVTQPGPGRSVFKGSLQDVEGGYFMFACTSNVMSGMVFAPGKGVFDIAYAGQGLHRIRERDATSMPGCQVLSSGNDTPMALPAAKIPDSSLQAIANTSVQIIDLLVVYTAGAGNFYENASMASFIDLAVEDANSAFQNSKVNIHLRLVHKAKVGYAESGDLTKDLARLTNPADGYMDEVAALRDQYKADLVCLFVENWQNDRNTAGASPATINAANGYSVVSTSYAIWGHVFAHEIGHNFGCQHDRRNAATPGIYPYSYGHVFKIGQWEYGTIMSSPAYRIPHFSNPGVSYGGIPTGIVSGKTNSANNAATLRLRAPIVAAYRFPTNSTVAPSATITAPAWNFVFRSNTNVIITASATDPDGSIARVDFLKEGELMGSSTGPDYSFHWTNAPLGYRGSWRVRAVDDQGVSTLSDSVSIQIAPLNDHFQDRQLLEGNDFSLPFNSAGATTEPGEPVHGWGSIWYEWTAPSNGLARVSLEAEWGPLRIYEPSGINFYIGNSLSNLVAVPQTVQDYFCEINLIAGTSYKIALSDIFYFGSSVRLALGYYQPVANDDAQNATVLAGSEFQINGNNTWATKETGEPDHGGISGGHSVWWQWTAPSSGLLEIHAESQSSLGIGVYTGQSEIIDGITRIIPGTPTPMSGENGNYRLNVEAGTTYFIAADSARTGNFLLELLHSPAPANDQFANRITLSGDNPVFIASNKGSSSETGEPVIGRGKTVWWTWTAPADGTIRVLQNASVAQVGIFTGNSVDQLSVVDVANGDPRDIPVSEGVSYQIVFDTYYSWYDENLDLIPPQFSTEASIFFTGPPSNDHFVNRSEVSGDQVTVRGSNKYATQEPGESLPSFSSAGQTVWWTWTPAENGTAIFKVSDCDFAALVSVYRGSELTNLVLEGPDYPISQETVEVTAGVPLQIAVDRLDDWWWDEPGGPFELSINLFTPPSNDMFANRIALAGASATILATNLGATVETDEPALSYDGEINRTVWWSWTAPEDTICTIETDDSNSSFDRYISVYTGSALPDLTRIAAGSYRATFVAIAGTTYQIQVGSYYGGAGYANFTLRCFPRPTNDAFEGRHILSGRQGTVQGNNLAATAESDEPWDYYFEGHSLWWTWTAPADGTMELAIDGGKSMVVFSGDELSALTSIAGEQGYAHFKAIKDEIYQIRVDGYEGPFEFTYLLKPTPPNDDFENRIVLVGESAQGTATNTFATMQFYEPGHAFTYAERSVWWSWTATTNSRVRLAAGASALLAVYTGEALEELTWVASSFQTGNLEFVAVEGVTYQIAVASDEYDTTPVGSISLTSEAMPLMANDFFAHRFTLTGSNLVISGFNATATNEPNEPIIGLGRTLWWSWTAPSSGRVELNTALAQVSTGSAISNLSWVATIEGSGFFQVSAGTTYQISLDSDGTYPYVICSLIFTAGPGNDDFSNAYPLSGQDVQVTGSNTGATTEPNEPVIDHGGSASIWYQWTPPGTGTTSFEISGSDVYGYGFSVSIDVFTGSNIANLQLVTSAIDLSDTFVASAGVKYFIRLNTPWGETGNLRLRLTQAPGNDLFANRKLVSGYVFEIAGSNRGASREANEPDHSYEYTGSSVWFSWRAPRTGTAYIQCSNPDNNFPSMAAVYRGSNLATLTSVAMASSGSVASFNVVAGTTYQIAVDSEYDSGRYSLKLWMNTGGMNDHFSKRIIIRGKEAVLVGRNGAATKEAGEPNHGGYQAGKSLWWSYKAAQNGVLVLHFSECNFTPTFGVYTGTNVTALRKVKCTVDYGGKNAVVMNVVAGTTYQIAVDGYRRASGNVRIQMRLETAPTNDAFEKRFPIAALPLHIAVNNVAATHQTGEPTHGIAGKHSLWWSWVAPEEQTVTFTINREGHRAFGAVYTGSSLAGLKLKQSNMSSGVWTDRITFLAEAGVEYQFVVDSLANQGGNVVIQIEPVNRPANDNIADAEPVTQNYIMTGSNIGATAEPGEPSHAGSPARRSVWWTWTPEWSGVVPVSTYDTSFDSLLSVYTVGTNSQLDLVAENDDSNYGYNAKVNVNAVAGTTYLIAVDGFNAAEGMIYLTVGYPYESIGSRTDARPSLQLQLKGPKEEMFVLQLSTNMVDWENVSTNRFTGSDFPLPRPNPSSHMQLYRAIPWTRKNTK